MEKKNWKPATLCVQAGWEPKNGESRVLPIYQSTTFKYDNTEEMADLFDLKKEGYFYTRLANPTNDAVARKIAALEGGVGAMLTSSGQAANFYALFNICEAGDHFVTSNEIYGGTYNLFGVTLKKLGIECTFISQEASEEEIDKAFRPNTKALFGETISNPGCKILDIEKFARIAHKHGVPLIVDNTFPTPINCRPFEWGADIVTHSTTKYMDGHATQVGGCVVDSGNFDWDAHADKFPGLCTPDESYHGLTYTKAFGKMAYMTKLVAQLMRDLGSIPAPQNAFLLNLGLETLHLRIKRHCENAQNFSKTLVTKWLKEYKFKNWTVHESSQTPVSEQERENRANEIASELCNHSKWLTHGRSIGIEELRELKLVITDYSKNPELNDAITRYFTLLQMSFETNIYKIYETPKSQIYRSINTSPPIENNPMQKLPNPLIVDFECGKCHGKLKMQINFNQRFPCVEGTIPFPRNNLVKCPFCGAESNVLGLRQQLEAQTKRKIVDEV